MLISFIHKPGLPFIWNCFTQWSKQIRTNKYRIRMQSNKNKILPGNCSKGRDKINDTYLQNCIKTILLSENVLQPIKIVVKLWKVWTISQPFYFLLWHRPSNFPPCWVCVDLVTMPCCLQAPGNDAGVSSLLVSDFLWFFPSFFYATERPELKKCIWY